MNIDDYTRLRIAEQQIEFLTKLWNKMKDVKVKLEIEEQIKAMKVFAMNYRMKLDFDEDE